MTDQDFDDDKGVGLVLVNTSKGKKYFDELGMTVRKSTLEKAHLCNGGFNEHTHVHPKRTLFFSLMKQTLTVNEAVAICTRISFLRKIQNKIIRFLRKVKHIIIR